MLADPATPLADIDSSQPEAAAVDQALTAWDDEGPVGDADDLREEDFDTETWDDVIRGLFD
jgi:hypothetical protein